MTKGIKKRFAIITALAVFTAVCLCLAGCGEKEQSGGNEYKIKIVDEVKKPVKGVTVTVCDDATCVPHTSDDDGLIVFDDNTDTSYVLHVIKVPEGYLYDGESDITFPAGKKEVTITLKLK